jgi:hypothetical protein
MGLDSFGATGIASVGDQLWITTAGGAAEGVQRAEVAGERAGAAVCADERVERDLADAQVPAPERLQSPLDLLELEQPVAAAGPQSPHLEVQRTAGCVKTRSAGPRARARPTRKFPPQTALTCL